MIPNSQIIEIISEQFPEMKFTCPKGKVLEGFQFVSAYAKELLEKGDQKTFKDLVYFVDQLYYHGDGKLKMGVDNVLLYNLSSCIDISPNAHNIREILPHRMRELIINQYGRSCI